MARYRAGLRTEAKIISATRVLLSEGGLEGTTLKLICERAGVLPGSFYNLFDSKEEAVLRVVGEAIATYASTRSDDPADLVEAYVAFVEGSPELAKIYLQIAVAGALTDGSLHERILGQHRSRVDRFARAIAWRDGTSSDAARLAAEGLLATLNGFAFRSMLEEEFDFAAHARRVLNGR